jgi:hypothetical protein
MNPDTGEMFQSPEEAINFVQTAALQPMPFEDLQTSMSVLATHMAGLEFESYPPQVQQAFIQHFTLLRQTAIQVQTALSGEHVKTTLRLNGTVGPTVASGILQQQGVANATPQTMAEAPLETNVYDSVDLPDQSAAGNNPLDDQERLLNMEQSQVEHMAKTAKMNADSALAEKRVQQSDFRPPKQARIGG